MKIAILTAKGVARVLEGRAGMTFPIESFGGVANLCANVRDYRFSEDGQIWTLGPDDYRVLSEE